MENEINPKEGFRKGFVLTLTLAYTIAFLAMLSGFFELEISKMKRGFQEVADKLTKQ